MESETIKPKIESSVDVINEKETNDSNKPVKKFVCGLVSATIWEKVIEKDGVKTSFYSTQIVKNYKPDNAIEWKSCSSFNKKDLHGVITVTQKAYEFIALKRL